MNHTTRYCAVAVLSVIAAVFGFLGGHIFGPLLSVLVAVFAVVSLIQGSSIAPRAQKNEDDVA
jgi:hypothetical protein